MMPTLATDGLLGTTVSQTTKEDGLVMSANAGGSVSAFEPENCNDLPTWRLEVEWDNTFFHAIASLPKDGPDLPAEEDDDL